LSILLLAVFATAQSPDTAKKKSTAKQTVHKTATAKAAPHAPLPASTKKATAASTPVKTASAATPHKPTASKSTKKPTVTVAHRSSQQQPTSDRYREIQQALADRGYFSGAPDGTWGSESTDALKRFQREQNLTDDGKIGSLSLIALGLGPKRVAVSTPPKVESPVESVAPSPAP
jgi:peptidoglycan hydrolase-like protein with peptidoglycan-binding domain